METLGQIILVMVIVFIVFIFRNPQPKKSSSSGRSSFAPIPDDFKTLEEVTAALRKAGLESSNLIVGIDYTKSNEYNGKKTYQGRSLHQIRYDAPPNPYQRVIETLGQTLEPFDDDKMIPVFGFGDIRTKDKGVFPFFEDRICYTFNEVLDRYIELTPLISLSGPTNLGPVIRKAIEIVKETKDYHILVIIADGQVDRRDDTISAIVEASYYPLSIVMVGVGDGPWEQMQEFDDKLPQRQFDNFQFVNFEEAVNVGPGKSPEPNFAMQALMEIPAQFQTIKTLGYLN